MFVSYHLFSCQTVDHLHHDNLSFITFQMIIFNVTFTNYNYKHFGIKNKIAQHCQGSPFWQHYDNTDVLDGAPVSEAQEDWINVWMCDPKSLTQPSSDEAIEYAAPMQMSVLTLMKLILLRLLPFHTLLPKYSPSNLCHLHPPSSPLFFTTPSFHLRFFETPPSPSSPHPPMNLPRTGQQPGISLNSTVVL